MGLGLGLGFGLSGSPKMSIAEGPLAPRLSSLSSRYTALALASPLICRDCSNAPVLLTALSSALTMPSRSALLSAPTENVIAIASPWVVAAASRRRRSFIGALSSSVGTLPLKTPSISTAARLTPSSAATPVRNAILSMFLKVANVYPMMVIEDWVTNAAGYKLTSSPPLGLDDGSDNGGAPGEDAFAPFAVNIGTHAGTSPGFAAHLDMWGAGHAFFDQPCE